MALVLREKKGKVVWGDEYSSSRFGLSERRMGEATPLRPAPLSEVALFIASADPKKLRVGIGEVFGRRTGLESTKVHAVSAKAWKRQPGDKKLEMKESFRAEINTVLMQNPKG